MFPSRSDTNVPPCSSIANFKPFWPSWNMLDLKIPHLYLSNRYLIVDVRRLSEKELCTMSKIRCVGIRQQHTSLKNSGTAVSALLYHWNGFGGSHFCCDPSLSSVWIRGPLFCYDPLLSSGWIKGEPLFCCDFPGRKFYIVFTYICSIIRTDWFIICTRLSFESNEVCSEERLTSCPLFEQQHVCRRAELHKMCSQECPAQKFTAPRAAWWGDCYETLAGSALK